MSTDIAPPKFLECPRCGATTFTRHGVALHDKDHAREDARDKQLQNVLDRLEAFLSAVEFEPDAAGHTQTFAGWMTETDDLLETLTDAVEALKTAGPTSAAPFVLEAGEWPTDVSSDDDASTEPDEDAGLAAVLTTSPTEAPDDDLEDPTSDDLDNRAAVALNGPITYGQTGVIA